MARAPFKPHVLVARNLHVLRLRASVTQEVLAERADVDLRSLQRIKAGAWNMTADYFARFQKALGCRWRDLIEGLDAVSLPVEATKTVKRGKSGRIKKELLKAEGGKITSKPTSTRGC